MELTYLLLCALIGLVTTVIYFLRKNFNYWKDRGVPGDDPHFVFGSMRGFRNDRILKDIYQDIYKKFKNTAPFCGIYFFQRPAAFILDTELAKEILIKNFPKFANRGLYHNERDDPLTGHLLALDGDKWKNLRHKLSPTFTSGKMKFMFPTVVAVAERFIDVFTELVANSDVVNVRELCARYTTDVIGTCAFGIECNSLKDPNAEFRLMGRNALTKTRHGNVLLGFMQSYPDLARKLRMRFIQEDVSQFFMRAVKETVAFREKNKIKRNDFMDLLIDLKNKNTMKTEDSELLAGLTIEEVAAQAFIFFLAGFETSSSTMGFALYELARYQDVQDKVRREINEVLSKHEQQFTYESFKEMIYLKQVMFETLRLYTIIPHLMRIALDDFVVPGHPEYRIEKGTMVLIPSSVYHVDQNLYPDPQAFKPERFSYEEILKRDSVEWLPFGDGPRNCIGKRFGEMQTRIGLALLLKNFKFTVCDQTQVPMVFDPKSIVLSAKGGIELRVEKLL